MLLCGRIFLVERFRLVFFPQIWERTDCVLEVRTFLHNSLRWIFFVSRILLWCHVPLEEF